MSGRNLFNYASFHDSVCNLSACPPVDWSSVFFQFFTGQLGDLTDLVGCNLCWHPERGRSSNLSAMIRSSIEVGCKSSQRCLHNYTVSKLTFISFAIRLLFCPLPAAKTILPHSPTCCPILCCLISLSNPSFYLL